MSANFIVPALIPSEAVCEDAGGCECYSQRKLLACILVFYEHMNKARLPL